MSQSQPLTAAMLAAINENSKVSIEFLVKNNGKKWIKIISLRDMGYTQQQIDADKESGSSAKQLTDVIEAFAYEYTDADWAANSDEDVPSATTDVTYRLYFGGEYSVIEETKRAHEWLEMSIEDYNKETTSISVAEEAFEDILLEWRNSQFDFTWQIA